MNMHNVVRLIEAALAVAAVAAVVMLAYDALFAKPESDPEMIVSPPMEPSPAATTSRPAITRPATD